MDFIVSFFTGITPLVLIGDGIISILSFGEKIASVMERESLSEWLKFISYFGFVFGILSLIVTAFNFISPYLGNNAVAGSQTHWDILVIGLAIGAALALKPIKDMKWASIISLAGGIAVMIIIWLIWSSAPSSVLIVAGIVTLLVLYLAFKFIEDFYLLISSIVTSPPVSVGLGILAVLEGVLLVFHTSILLFFGL